MKKYKAIFLDWDDTIGDFGRSAKCALTTMFEIHQLYQYTDYDTFVRCYSEHNTLLWEQYGRDEVTKEVLKIERFMYPLIKACYYETNPTCIKYMLSKRGFGSQAVRLPLGEISMEHKAQIDALLKTAETSWMIQ